jgi:hypothetical protein
VAARRQPRGSDRNGAACGSASEIFHGAHPISPRLRSVAILERIPMKWNRSKWQWMQGIPETQIRGLTRNRKICAIALTYETYPLGQR